MNTKEKLIKFAKDLKTFDKILQSYLTFYFANDPDYVVNEGSISSFEVSSDQKYVEIWANVHYTKGQYVETRNEDVYLKVEIDQLLPQVTHKTS